MAGYQPTPTSTDREPSLSIWRQALRWFFHSLLLIVGLIFAPITSIIALIIMLKNGRRGGYKDAFRAFVDHHLYTMIALLIVEVGLLHWLFPVSNFIASTLLGLLATPVLWGILGGAAAILVMACALSYLDRCSNPPLEKVPLKVGIFERFVFPLVAFVFAPISTILGLLLAHKKPSLAALIKNNPFIAFGFVALEVGLLHSLVPTSNFVLGFAVGAFGTVITPLLWTLVALASAFLLYSIYKNFSSKKQVVVPKQGPDNTRATALAPRPTDSHFSPQQPVASKILPASVASNAGGNCWATSSK